jgi:hypothetical protein
MSAEVAVPDKLQQATGSGITGRAILIGLALIPLNCMWIAQFEYRWDIADTTCIPLFMTALFMLMVLALMNLVARRFFPRAALSKAELIVIYIMVMFSCIYISQDQGMPIFGTLGHAYRFATPENKFEQYIWPNLPQHLVVSDTNSLRGLYEGGTTIYRWDNFQPWLLPLAGWGSMLFVLAAMMLSMNLLLRRAWIESEKLSFPVIRVPMLLAESAHKPSVLMSWPLWAGFITAFVISLYNGISYLHPTMPPVPAIKWFDASKGFASPWNTWNFLGISGYPFMVGMAFFLPLNLSFSCWFFWIFSRVTYVIGKQFGFAEPFGWPYYGDQASGAWLMVPVLALYASRRHLIETYHTIVGAWNRGGKSNEPVDPFWPLVVLIGGFIFLLVFMHLAGMDVAPAAGYYGLYLLSAITFARVRAQFGSPTSAGIQPDSILVQAFGPSAFTHKTLAVFATMYFYNHYYRAHAMPNQLETLKMGQETKLDTAKISGVILLATAAGIVASFWAGLDMSYKWGGSSQIPGFPNWAGDWTYNKAVRWMETPAAPQLQRLSRMGIGAVVVTFLFIMHTRFVGWPLHPVAYALNAADGLQWFQFCFFIAWLIKWVIMRYGGRTTYNRAIDYFCGLILGDYAMGCLWGIIGIIFHTRTYGMFL